MKKYNHYEFFEDCVLVYPQDRDDIYTILDYKWYEYFKENNIYIFPKADKDNGYYWYFKSGNKSTSIHSIICCPHCDHKNNNKSDNRAENLRPATPFENACNRKYTVRNKTGYKGVQNERNKFCVQLRHKGKLMYFGTFDTAEEAAKVYDLAALKYFGEFAWTNFPKENYSLEDIENVTPSTMKNRKRMYRKRVRI